MLAPSPSRTTQVFHKFILDIEMKNNEKSSSIIYLQQIFEAYFAATVDSTCVAVDKLNFQRKNVLIRKVVREAIREETRVARGKLSRDGKMFSFSIRFGYVNESWDLTLCRRFPSSPCLNIRRHRIESASFCLISWEKFAGVSIWRWI